MNLFRDIRYSVRKLVKSPAFSAVVILSLALGIGGNVTIFGLINATLFRPLPAVKEPDQLVWAFTSNRGARNQLPTSYADYLDLRDQNNAFNGLAAFDGESLSLNTGGESEVVQGELASGNYFSVLGVEAALGRVFKEEDDRAQGASPVAVISHGLWQRRFGADRSVVGRSVTFNGASLSIIGVTPKEFVGTEVGMTPDVWVPLSLYAQLMPPPAEGEPSPMTSRDFRRFKMLGRLKPNVSASQAQASLATVARRLEEENPATNRRMSAAVTPLSGGLNPRDREDMLPAAGLLLAMMGLVLLIACVNVASLLLTRAAARQQEVAVRLALGAPRARLVGQLLIESLVLFVIGGALGLFIANWATDLLLALAPTDKAVVIDSVLDYRVFVFALLLSLLTGMIFGLVPALQASKPDLVMALKSKSARKGGRRQSRLRNIFLVAQVAFSLVLLISAGLFIRSLQNSKSVQPGFTVENALVVPLDLGMQRYSEARGMDFYRRVTQRVGSMPGVKSVSLSKFVPLGFSSSGQGVVTIEGKERSPDTMPPMVGLNVAWPDYFKTMGIPLLRGREFNEGDRPDSPEVVIINETAAARFWPGEDPIGKRLSTGGARGPFAEVVGVAKDIKSGSLEEDAQPYLYGAATQKYQSAMSLVVRTQGDPRQMVESVRAQVLDLDGKLVVSEIRTLEEQVSRSLYPSRIAAWLLGVYGALALALAAVGLYGMLSYSVVQRTHEIGVRMALGARQGDVVRLILKEGMRLVGYGMLIGVALAFGVTRVLASVVYGVSITDPAVFGVVILTLAAVSLVASYIPARRGTRVAPVIALRAD
jgi:predicted permease